MRQQNLRNFTEVAEDLTEELGRVKPTTISELVRIKGIQTKSLGIPGRARGLDDNDIAILREALKPVPKPPARKSTVRKSAVTASR